MKYSQILIEAKDLLSDPENWNQDGFYYKSNNPESDCYCTFGAIYTVMNLDPEGEEADKVSHSLAELLGFEVGIDLVEWNDSPETTHEELMGVFDKAITKAEELGWEFEKH